MCGMVCVPRGRFDQPDGCSVGRSGRPVHRHGKLGSGNGQRRHHDQADGSRQRERNRDISARRNPHGHRADHRLPARRRAVSLPLRRSGISDAPATGRCPSHAFAFEGDAIDLKVYAPCTPIANAATAGACSVAIPADIEASLAGASEATTLTETVRLASASGANLGESTAIDARWASLSLPGTVYYWSAPPSGGGGAGGESEIRRMDLTRPGTPPGVFYQWLDAEGYSPMT